MIIALVGTPSAGKHTVLNYLVTKHDFKRLDLVSSALEDLALDALSVADSVRPESAPRPQSPCRSSAANML